MIGASERLMTSEPETYEHDAYLTVRSWKPDGGRGGAAPSPSAEVGAVKPANW